MSGFYLDTDNYDETPSASHEYDSMPVSPMRESTSNGNGLGSLADELAAAWEDDEEEEEEEEEELEEDAYVPPTAKTVVQSPKKKDARLSNGTTISSTSTSTPMRADSPDQQPQQPQQRDLNGIPASLQYQMDQIEAEALKGLAMMKGWKNRQIRAGDEDDVKRLMMGLQELKTQSGIESGSQRLITAHNALSSHLASQTRLLRDLSFLITPLHPIFDTTATSSNDPSLYDHTCALLDSLTPLIPQPTSLPLQDLAHLANLSSSLTAHLASISDSLHMAKQQNILATRRLRSAKDAAREWRGEIEMVERARGWIEEGDWDSRLKGREAERVCRDVLGGFEDVCRGYERRIAGFC